VKLTREIRPPLTYFTEESFLSSSSSSLLGSDQVIRENPASRGTETSAEVLVGPPSWRMESNAGQQQRY
jgi:hypothetical protein